MVRRTLIVMLCSVLMAGCEQQTQTAGLIFCQVRSMGNDHRYAGAVFRGIKDLVGDIGVAVEGCFRRAIDRQLARGNT